METEQRTVGDLVTECFDICHFLEDFGWLTISLFAFTVVSVSLKKDAESAVVLDMARKAPVRLSTGTPGTCPLNAAVVATQLARTTERRIVLSMTAASLRGML